MGIQDKKTVSMNISARQLVGIGVAFGLCAVAIYAEALTIGYIVVTLALCVLFVIVAFDLGVNRSAPAAVAEVEPAPESDVNAPAKGRSGRSARTA
jgi:hypothetical protein